MTAKTQQQPGRIPVAELAPRLLSGDRRALAKSITLVESSRDDHREQAQDLLERLLPHTGTSVRLGITGVPGVGKSTFIEAFGLDLISQGRSVAVLAVDPSSSVSGGSILGDKTRMPGLATNDKAFIRPSPASGALGGVAARTREVMLLCEAAGFDVVMVETVGVGQSEYHVASMVDFFLVLMLAGAGDELQGMKKGILELADALVVNKADGDNLARATRAQAQSKAALHFMRARVDGWEVPVLTASALEKKGIDEVWDAVQRHRELALESGAMQRKRASQRESWFWSLLDEGLRKRFLARSEAQARLADLLRDVGRDKITPMRAALELLRLL